MSFETQKDYFRLEYNWTDHRVYRHQNSINDYYSHGYPIGFWAGPHAQELYLNYTFNKFNTSFSFTYSAAKRGELLPQMLVNQYNNEDYDRFNNHSESLTTFKILISKQLKNGIEVHFGITSIDWINADFDPYFDYIEGFNLININKNSFSVGFSHNFNIFNQSSEIRNNSIKKIVSF